MAKISKPSNSSRPRKSKLNTFTTKSGKTIKRKQSFSQRLKSHRDAKALRKAEMLRDMPKGRIQRIVYRLHPKRLYRYWFSKDGGLTALKIIGIGFVAMLSY